MDIIKKILGVVCILLAPIAFYLLTDNGIKEIAKAAKKDKTAEMAAAAITAAGKIPAAVVKTVANATTQWSILIIIFLPIMAGLLLFGWYAFKGEYSTEIQ